ncbi:MAG: carbon-nitrogen family hydrolase [Actinobacteria bacterium]|nr:carbon-nitrogen family hydrolase [Actinomycetota bacterium]
MKVAAIQHDIVWEDPEANFTRLAPMIADAAAGGAGLVVLAEMYSTGFSMDTARIAEPVDGPSTRFLADQAAAQGVWVCGSLPARAAGDDRPTNCLVLAGPQGELHRYAKIHPFGYAGEDEWFASGDRLVTVDVDGLRVSLFVCYDLRFADDFWALAHDTDCYVVVANWPAPRRAHWQTLLRARAIENQAYVVAVNRVGTGGKLSYAGDSAIIGPFGEELAVAVDGGDVGAEQTLTSDVDAAHVTDIRARYPFLQDRAAP